MSFFNQYPYLNINDLNLDFILNAIKEMRNEVTNFVSINAIKYADPIQWNITRQYEKNTIVIDPLTGTAYISVSPVPSGVALTREEYWTVVFDLQSFVTKANQNIANNYESETTTTATMNTNAGAWVIWGDVLYKALVNITAGDAYVINSNIKRITIEDVYVEYLNTIAQIITNVGDLNNLSTTDKDSIVDAINEVNSNVNTLDTKVGDLNNLSTTDKDSTVDAINEVNSNVNTLDTKVGDLNNLTTTDKDSIVGAINEVNSNVGDLNNLTTTDKDSIVGAINEVNLRLNRSVVVTPEMYGAIGDGVTDDTNAIIAALTNGDICVCTNTYKTTSPISVPTRKYLIVSGTISYTGTDGAINLDNRYSSILGTGLVESDGDYAIKITSARVDIKNLTLSVTGNYTAAIIIESTSNTAGIAYVNIEKVYAFGRSSDTYHGTGLYIHTTNNGFINENRFVQFIPAYFVNGVEIFNDAGNSLNHNEFIKYDGEGCTRHLYAYSTSANIQDNIFEFRTEEFGNVARIHIDNHVIRNKFKALGFAPKNFSVINPAPKALFTGGLVNMNLIEGLVLTDTGATVGYNGAFHINGNIIVFDVNSKREPVGYYDGNEVLTRSSSTYWPSSFIDIAPSSSSTSIDLNYVSDWCSSPLEYININNSSGTTFSIKNDSTILYGPTALSKGLYKVVYNRTMNGIMLVKLTTA